MSLSLSDRGALAEKVKSKIDTIIMEMFTDEQWQSLIEKAIKDLTLPKPAKYSGNPDEPSPLSVMIKNELDIKVREKISAAVSSYIQPDGLTTNLLEELITKIVKDPGFINLFIQNLLGQSLSNLRFSIESSLQQALASKGIF